MRRFSRREVLGGAALGGVAGLAGCMYLPWNSPIATVESGETRDVSGGPIQSLSVDAFPDWVPFTGSVTVRRQPSDNDPGHLGIAIRNEGPDAWTLSVPSLELPFYPAVSENGLSLGTYGPSKQRDGCIRGAEPGDDAVDEKRLEEGESVDGRRYLYTHLDAAACYPAGDHRITNRYFPIPPGESERDKRFQWGFTLTVE